MIEESGICYQLELLEAISKTEISENTVLDIIMIIVNSPDDMKDSMAHRLAQKIKECKSEEDVLEVIRENTTSTAT